MTDHRFLASDIDEIVAGIAEDASQLSGKSILLSGGAGFLGSYYIGVLARLCERLEKPCSLTVLDHKPVDPAEFAAIKGRLDLDFIRHDVTKPWQEHRRFDFVIHAAGIPSPFYYRAAPLETLEVATLGCRHLLDIAQRCNARFIFFSSSEVYGNPDSNHVPTSESYRGNVSSTGPRSMYDESKRLGETLCYIFHVRYGVHTNAIRPFNVYGPGMPDKDYRVLPNFASCIKNGRPISIYGTGKQTRTFTYVTDAMTGFLKVMLRGMPGEIYNIGSPGPEVSMLQLAERLERILERKINYRIIQYPDLYPEEEALRRCPDIVKAERQLGFAPRVSIEEGMRRFFGWADRCYTRHDQQP